MTFLKKHAAHAALLLAALIFFTFFTTQAIGSVPDPKLRAAALLLGAALTLLLLIGIFRGAHETVLMTGILLALLALYSLAFPLGKAPDEREHFLRGYEIAQGQLLSKHLNESGLGGNVLPAALERYADPAARIDWNQTAALAFGNTSLYAPLCYLPQAAGMRLAGWLTDQVSAIFYAGRAANALISFLLCALALRWMPYGRKALFLTLIFPISLQEMVSVSPDSLTISVSALWLAAVLRYSYTPAPVGRRQKALLIALALTLSLCKIVYVTLAALALLIPAEKLGGRKRAARFKCALLIGAAALNLAWLAISAGYLTEFRPGVDPAAQTVYLLTHLPQYYLAVSRTVLAGTENWIRGMIDKHAGALAVEISPLVWICFYTAFLCVLLDGSCGTARIKKADPWILFGTVLVCCALIFTCEYVQWTPLRAKAVEGVQGRYFLPLLGVFAAGAMTVRGRGKPADKPAFWILIPALLLNGVAIVEMMRFYA